MSENNYFKKRNTELKYKTETKIITVFGFY